MNNKNQAVISLVIMFLVAVLTFLAFWGGDLLDRLNKTEVGQAGQVVEFYIIGEDRFLLESQGWPLSPAPWNPTVADCQLHPVTDRPGAWKGRCPAPVLIPREGEVIVILDYQDGGPTCGRTYRDGVRQGAECPWLYPQE